MPFLIELNSRFNTNPAEDCSEIFFIYIKLHTFADKYDIASLKVITAEKLDNALN
jgi:hypothetical protein